MPENRTVSLSLQQKLTAAGAGTFNKTQMRKPGRYRPEHYKKLTRAACYAYNRLVKDRETGQISLRMHISRHPLFVAGRRKAGQAKWLPSGAPAFTGCALARVDQFCDAGKHTVGCVSRVWRKSSVPETPKAMLSQKQRVTVSRLSRLIEEQVRFGVLGPAEERRWDRESKSRLPTYVFITGRVPDARGKTRQTGPGSRKNCVSARSVNS